jgi:hypothetical protein
METDDSPPPHGNTTAFSCAWPTLELQLNKQVAAPTATVFVVYRIIASRITCGPIE